jgi:hypothetical protein
MSLLIFIAICCYFFGINALWFIAGFIILWAIAEA